MDQFQNLKQLRKRRDKLPSVFNKEQLIDLFDCIDNPQTMIGAGLGFFCGLRISEVIRLEKKDLDFKKRQIKVVEGKGGKDAYCVIPPQLVEPLRLWLKYSGESPFVFPSLTNPRVHIGKSEMFRKFVKALKKAGLRVVEGYVEFKNRYGTYRQLKYRYYFHTLRHSYATHLHEQGVDIATVSKLMRHNQVDTTMIYTHISNREKQKAVDSVFDPFKAYHFKKSDFQDKREQVFQERERQFMERMSHPVNMLQLKLVNGEISPEEFKKRLEALKSMPNMIEVV